MKLKKVLRMLALAIFLFAYGWIAISFLLGKGTTFSNIVLVIASVFLLLKAIRAILPAIMSYRTYRIYTKLFYEIKRLHEARYELYFSQGREKEIEMCTKEIRDGANLIIVSGRNLLESKFLTQKQKDNLKKIIEDTKMLVKKAQPTM